MSDSPAQPLLATHAPPRHQIALILFLLAAYFLLRLPNLTAQPLFCDEAAYLRWAQLIRADPLHNYWVSMNDYKLPFHYWLLAVFYLPNADPIFAGRLLSVLTGAAIIPLLFAIGTELHHLATFHQKPAILPPARYFAPLASAFMITSPLFASFQRMALAEPLLLLESVALVFFSLRLARIIATQPNPRDPLPTAILLGLIWAATLLTKQNFSYLLWLFPPLALALYAAPASRRALAKKFLLPFLLITTLGLLFFLPAVLTTNLFNLKLNIFYKPNFFRVPGISRTTILLQNLIALLSPRIEYQAHWWPHDPAAPLDDGSLYLYLTPPIFLLLIAGAIQLLRRRAHLPLAFFGTWTLILLGSVIANYNWIRTRYALLGIFPLLLLVAWITAELLAGKRPLRMRPPAFRISLLTLLFAWPLIATVAQLRDFAAPTRTRLDRSEYLSGSSAGESAQAAVQWLQSQAALHPITVLTNSGFGTNDDLTWLLLANNKNVQLLATDSLPLSLPKLNPDGSMTFCTEQWFPERTAPVRLDPARPTFVLQSVGANIDHAFPCNPLPSALAPRAQLVRILTNAPTTSREQPAFATAIIQLSPPPSPLASATPQD